MRGKWADVRWCALVCAGVRCAAACLAVALTQLARRAHATLRYQRKCACFLVQVDLRHFDRSSFHSSMVGAALGVLASLCICQVRAEPMRIRVLGHNGGSSKDAL